MNQLVTKKHNGRDGLAAAAIAGGLSLLLGVHVFPAMITWVWAGALAIAIVAYLIVSSMGDF